MTLFQNFTVVAVLAWVTAGRISAAGEVVAWGAGSEYSTFPNLGQAQVPGNLGDVIQIAAGGFHSLALTGSGEVRVWGSQPAAPPGLSKIVAIAAGRVHSLALDRDGQVVAWGQFAGDEAIRVPESLNRAVAIAAGDAHSLALTADGRLVAWGANQTGQTTIPEGCSNVVAIAAGGSVSLALTADDRVICWGFSEYGQTRVPPVSGVVAIAAGYSHDLALQRDGRVVAWGSGVPGINSVPSNLSNVVAIAAGLDVSYALQADGRVVRWGPGTTTVTPPNNSIQDPSTLSNVVAVSIGQAHGLALKGESPGRAAPEWSAPRNLVAVAQHPFIHRLAIRNGYDSLESRRLPLGLTLDPTTGVLEGIPTTPGVYDVEFMAKSALGWVPWRVRLWVNAPALAPVEITNRGAAAAALGSGFDLQMDAINSPEWFRAVGLPPGLGINEQTGLISGVPAMVGEFVVQLSAGNGTSGAVQPLVIRVSPLVAFGGYGPGSPEIPAGISNVVRLDANGSVTMALLTDRRLVRWGGQITEPQWSEASNLAAVGAGDLTTAGLTTAGQVFEWDAYHSNPPPPDTQVPRPGLNDAVAISARGLVFLALRSNGQVDGWGEYTDGFTRTPVLVPQLLQIRSNIVSVAAGTSLAAVLTRDGDAYVMGQRVESMGVGKYWLFPRGTVAVAAGRDHALALRADGRVLAWGENSSGQCTIPQDLYDAVAIAAGERHSVALTARGTVVAWGANDLGQTTVPRGLSNVVGIVCAAEATYALMVQPTVLLPRLSLKAGSNGMDLVAEAFVGVVGTLFQKTSLDEAWKLDQAVVFTNETQVLQRPEVSKPSGYYHLIRH